MVPRVRSAVLISGRGSNLAALISACRSPDYPAEIVLVISNVAGAEGLNYAASANIPSRVISHTDFESREKFDETIDRALRDSNVSLVCEAGFMRIHSDAFLRRWEGRLVNIHPSLLPSFKGLRVHRQVLDARVRISRSRRSRLSSVTSSRTSYWNAASPCFFQAANRALLG